MIDWLNGVMSFQRGVLHVVTRTPCSFTRTSANEYDSVRIYVTAVTFRSETRNDEYLRFGFARVCQTITHVVGNDMLFKKNNNK